MAKTTLKQARQQVGWTQTQLANEVGAGVSTINELENSETPNPGYQLVMRIVLALRSKGLELEAEDIFPIEVGDRRSGDDRRTGADRREGVVS